MCLVPTGYRRIAHVSGNAFGMEQPIPDSAGFELHAGGSGESKCLKTAKRSSKIAAFCMNGLGEAKTVFDRHTGALRQRLQRRVRRVAEEYNTAFVPMPYGIAIGD